MRSKSEKGPSRFSDFGRKAKEILTRGYGSKQRFTVSSQSDNGVTIVSSLSKKGSLSYGGVAVQHKSKNTFVDFRVDTNSNISTALTFNNILPSTKAIVSCRFPDYKSGKFEVQYLHEHTRFTMGIGLNKYPAIDISQFEAQYFHEHLRFTIAIGLNKSPAIDVSATVGTPSIAFGTRATYTLASCNFAKYNAGVSLTKPNFTVSVILAEKGDAVSAIYLQYLGRKKRLAFVGEMARKFSANENTLTVGCAYTVDHHTFMKAKLNNHGSLRALLQLELKPKSFLTVSGAFNTKALERIPRFGVSLYLVS